MEGAAGGAAAGRGRGPARVKAASSAGKAQRRAWRALRQGKCSAGGKPRPARRQAARQAQPGWRACVQGKQLAGRCAGACAGRARRAWHAGVRAVQAPRQAGQRARCAGRTCGRCALAPHALYLTKALELLLPPACLVCCHSHSNSHVLLSKVARLVACASYRRKFFLLLLCRRCSLLEGPLAPSSRRESRHRPREQLHCLGHTDLVR